MSKTTLTALVTCGAALCALASQACAAADVFDTDRFVTPAGPYVGVGWGRFGLHLDNLDQVGTAANTIVHSNDNAWTAKLGYRFSPYIALEGDYVNFGNPSDTFQGTGSNGNYNLHMSGFAPFAVGTLPIGPAELFGKAGYLFYDSNLKVNLNGGQAIQSSHSSSDFIYGGGVGVTLVRHLNLNAEYDVVRVQNARSSNAFWLSGAWRF